VAIVVAAGELIRTRSGGTASEALYARWTETATLDLAIDEECCSAFWLPQQHLGHCTMLAVPGCLLSSVEELPEGPGTSCRKGRQTTIGVTRIEISYLILEETRVSE
jgi:hypothetical protein